MGTVIGRETTRSKERPEGSTWKSSLYWTLMMLQGPGDQEYCDNANRRMINNVTMKINTSEVCWWQ